MTTVRRPDGPRGDVSRRRPSREELRTHRVGPSGHEPVERRRVGSVRRRTARRRRELGAQSFPARSPRWCRTPAARRSATRLITRRISLVAVCCSSASVRSRLRASSSVNRRTFSIAMTAWSAKVLSSAICLSRERTRLEPADGDRADRACRRAAAERPATLRKPAGERELRRSRSRGLRARPGS